LDTGNKLTATIIALDRAPTLRGAKGSGAPPGERNGQYRHGERTKAAIAERQKFSALLKMLRAGLELISDEHCVIELSRL